MADKKQEAPKGGLINKILSLIGRIPFFGTFLTLPFDVVSLWRHQLFPEGKTINLAYSWPFRRAQKKRLLDSALKRLDEEKERMLDEARKNSKGKEIPPEVENAIDEEYKTRRIQTYTMNGHALKVQEEKIAYLYNKSIIEKEDKEIEKLENELNDERFKDLGPIESKEVSEEKWKQLKETAPFSKFIKKNGFNITDVSYILDDLEEYARLVGLSKGLRADKKSDLSRKLAKENDEKIAKLENIMKTKIEKIRLEKLKAKFEEIRKNNIVYAKAKKAIDGSYHKFYEGVRTRMGPKGAPAFLETFEPDKLDKGLNKDNEKNMDGVTVGSPNISKTEERNVEGVTISSPNVTRVRAPEKTKLYQFNLMPGINLNELNLTVHQQRVVNALVNNGRLVAPRSIMNPATLKNLINQGVIQKPLFIGKEDRWSEEKLELYKREKGLYTDVKVYTDNRGKRVSISVEDGIVKGARTDKEWIKYIWQPAIAEYESIKAEYELATKLMQALDTRGTMDKGLKEKMLADPAIRNKLEELKVKGIDPETYILNMESKFFDCRARVSNMANMNMEALREHIGKYGLKEIDKVDRTMFVLKDVRNMEEAAIIKEVENRKSSIKEMRKDLKYVSMSPEKLEKLNPIERAQAEIARAKYSSADELKKQIDSASSNLADYIKQTDIIAREQEKAKVLKNTAAAEKVAATTKELEKIVKIEDAKRTASPILERSTKVETAKPETKKSAKPERKVESIKVNKSNDTKTLEVKRFSVAKDANIEKCTSKQRAIIEQIKENPDAPLASYDMRSLKPLLDKGIVSYKNLKDKSGKPLTKKYTRKSYNAMVDKRTEQATVFKAKEGKELVVMEKNGIATMVKDGNISKKLTAQQFSKIIGKKMLDKELAIQKVNTQAAPSGPSGR